MKCWRPPRVSQIPSSAWSQFSQTQSTIRDRSHPGVVGDRPAVLVEEVDGVDELAVDVELELVGGAVPDAHGGRAAVALPVVEDLLLEIGVAVDRVHDLERPGLALVLLAEPVGQPAAERRGLLGEAEPQQRVEGERGVADPRVAVVPVAAAAELLGEARGRGGDERARRPVRQELQRQRGTPDDLAPPSLVARRRDPAQPVVDRLVEQLARVVLGVRPRLRRPARGRTSRSGPARGRTSRGRLPPCARTGRGPRATASDRARRRQRRRR